MDPAENRIRKIVLERLGYCRTYHRQHEGGDVHVVSQNPDAWIMVVECPDCRTRSFVAAVVDERLAEDARESLKRLAGEHQHHSIDARPQILYPEAAMPAEPVSVDDVESVRSFLDTFNGDFKRLFAKG